MKKFLLRLLAAVMAGAALASCKGASEEDIEPQVLEVHPSPIVLGPLETEISVTVDCDLTWSPSLEDNSWGSVEVKERKDGKGGTLLIKATVNAGELPRENTLIIKAGKGVIREKVTQEGLSTFFSPRNVTLVGTDPVIVSFKSPDKWKTSVVEGNDWLRVDRIMGNAGDIELKVYAMDANQQVGDRTGKVRVTIGSGTNIIATADISVLQGQKDCIFITEDTALSYPFDPQELTLHAKYNVDYKVTSTVDWITVTTTKAPLHEAEETFSIAENPNPEQRTGHIVFSSEGHPDAAIDVTVVQGGKDALINITEPGLYGFKGADYILGTDGWNQRTVLKGADGSLRYRLLNQSNLGAIEVSGMKVGDQRDATVTLNLRHVQQGGLLHLKKYQATVLYVKDGTTWYKIDNNMCFIAK